jgi:hypothetical protein
VFHNSTLVSLASTTGSPLVSVFLPTAPHSSDTQKGALHLKGLLGQARVLLGEQSTDSRTIDALLEPAESLISDRQFWQHQRHGLALFLSLEGMTSVSVDAELSPSVSAGEHCDVVPLLPHLTPDTEFLVLCVSEAEAQLYRGNSSTLSTLDVPAIPQNLDAVITDEDYENPVLASPSARPSVGTHNMSNSQVYGKAPPEWRSMVQGRFIERVAKGVRSVAGYGKTPLVIIADKDFAGHLASALASDATEMTHPASLSVDARHDRAWSHIEPLHQKSRSDAVERLVVALAHENGALIDLSEIAVAAKEGRVDTLYVSDTQSRPVLSQAIADTVRTGGKVVWAGGLEHPLQTGVGALLRY